MSAPQRGARAAGPSAGAPRPLGALVRRARAALLAARFLQSALLGAAGLALTLAAAALSGAAPARADARAAALCAGALAGLAWWLEHRSTAAGVARLLDRRLGEEGAFVTAFEVEARRAPGELAALLQARVRARLDARRALRAVLPSFALPGAAPLLGVAALCAVLELEPAAPGPAPVQEVSAGLATALASLGGSAADPAAAGAALGEARALAALLTSGESPPPGALLARVEALDRRLAALACAAPELRAGLGEARAWLDALRQDLTRASAAAESEPGPGAHGTPGAPVTGGTAEGTMARSTPPAGGGDAPSGAEGAVPAGADGGGAFGGTLEVGVAGGAWWPARHDEVVRRWLERGAGR